MKTDIKPSPTVKKLLPIDAVPDRQSTQHYRVRKDGSLIYTNGTYAAITPPDPYYLEVGEQIKAIDGTPAADGIRLPDDEALERVKLGPWYYRRQRILALEKLAEVKARAEKFPPITEHDQKKIVELNAQSAYYTDKIDGPTPPEMVLDVALLKKLVDWFAVQAEKGKHAPRRVVKIAIYTDGGKTQLQIHGVGAKVSKDTPAPLDGYEAWLMGCKD